LKRRAQCEMEAQGWKEVLKREEPQRRATSIAEEEKRSRDVAKALFVEDGYEPKWAAWAINELCELGWLQRRSFYCNAIRVCAEGGPGAEGRLLASADWGTLKSIGKGLSGGQTGVERKPKRLMKVCTPKSTQLGRLVWRHQVLGGSLELYDDLAEIIGADPRGTEELSPGLALDFIRHWSAGKGCGSLWRVIWKAVCGVLPGGGRRSPRWRAVEALSARPDADEAFSWLAAQPNWSAQFGSAIDYYGKPVLSEDELQYPVRVGKAKCGCVDCNTPSKTSEFLDARGRGGPHLDEFKAPLQAEFIRRIPRRALEWSRAEWEAEAANDEKYIEEYRAVKLDPERVRSRRRSILALVTQSLA
jgi:hypothetical protein